MRRIKWLEEKLTEQQEKLFKLLNKDSTVDIRTELDAQKGEVKDVSRDIKKRSLNQPVHQLQLINPKQLNLLTQ
ncbi:hypothetical protein BHE89_13900 [Shigella sp. FC1967]|uniref:hypothetical protein n=1 Tax=Shigella sp. FC1967 TaxID=1898041 RepID=UPI00086BBBFC|nr:hypothetical protein [Shigella sp. FC1967]OEJ08130.1 hypothetical protein BHE89_13900 [Shigella sp. FC1967]